MSESAIKMDALDALSILGVSPVREDGTPRAFVDVAIDADSAWRDFPEGDLKQQIAIALVGRGDRGMIYYV